MKRQIDCGAGKRPSAPRNATIQRFCRPQNVRDAAVRRSCAVPLHTGSPCAVTPKLQDMRNPCDCVGRDRGEQSPIPWSENRTI